MIPIFFAADIDRWNTQRLLEILGDEVAVKFGLKFIYNHGLDACWDLAHIGVPRRRQMFIDVKLHDIPYQVAGGVTSIIEKLNPEFITLHTCDGPKPLKAAVEARDEIIFSRTKLLGVTVLTSEAENEPEVLKRGRYAYEAGLDGLICSAHNIAALRRIAADTWPDMFLMVPGIRMGENHHDQVQVATPRQAMDAGASALVIGREIYDSDDPLATVRAIRKTLT